MVGIEGGGSTRHALVANLVNSYEHVYEVGPLFVYQSQTKEEKQLLSLIVTERKKGLERIKKMQKKLEAKLDGLLEAEGKTKKHAMRCLTRRIASIV